MHAAHGLRIITGGGDEGALYVAAPGAGGDETDDDDGDRGEPLPLLVLMVVIVVVVVVVALSLLHSIILLICTKMNSIKMCVSRVVLYAPNL